MPSATKSRSSLVEHLTTQADNVPEFEGLDLYRYYRQADLLITQAQIYRQGRNEEQLYVMLLRLATLIIQKLPKQKCYKSNDTQYVKLKKLVVDKFLPELENLKLSLNTREQDVSHLTLHTTRRQTDVTPFAPASQVSWPPTTSAVALQQHQPASASSSSSSSSAPWDFYTPGSHSTSTTPPNTLASTSGVSISTTGSLSYAAPRKESLARHALLFPRTTSTGLAAPAATPAASLPKWPAFDSTPTQQLDLLSFEESGSPQQLQRPQPANGNYSLLDAPPSMMPAMGDASMPIMHPQVGPSLGPQQVEVSLVDPNRAMAGDSCSHRPPSHLENSMVAVPSSSSYQKEYQKRPELRDVHISVALMEEFLQFAQSNTRRSIESCGILAGILTPDDSLLTVTTLIVPKQKGSSDMVEMLAEEEMYEVMVGQGLLPLGWIHTHPSQTCFMSSIDIHTHCGFQTQLDEAVAIVMAPTDRNKKCGIFRLTTPGGMSLIQKCNHRGFHTHPPTHTGQEIYEDSCHIFLNPRTKHTVVDLR